MLLVHFPCRNNGLKTNISAIFGTLVKFLSHQKYQLNMLLYEMQHYLVLSINHLAASSVHEGNVLGIKK